MPAQANCKLPHGGTLRSPKSISINGAVMLSVAISISARGAFVGRAVLCTALRFVGARERALSDAPYQRLSRSKVEILRIRTKSQRATNQNAAPIKIAEMTIKLV